MRSFAVLALTLACVTCAHGASLEASRALVKSLESHGRAEATLRYALAPSPGAPVRSVHATLALEPPDRARLDVPATGEKITLRRDGGEWLQPALQQLVRLRPEHAVAALRWWRVLLGDGSGVRERALPAGGFRLVTTAAAPDSADVWLDAKGLPARLELPDGSGGRSVYRLSAWRFSRARGEAAFRLSAPAGVVVVDLP